MTDPHIHFSMLEDALLSGTSVKRLLMSCAMGGAIGIEREWRQKDSGLRTNMLICMGACLFTIMSVVLAGDSTPNKGQVAANIVQGIGFLGAGLILHAKNRVLGLTSAATVFVVAAIGMACGTGLYFVALVATVLVLIALQLVGFVEIGIGWKRYSMIYEVRVDIGVMLPADLVGEARAAAMAQETTNALHRAQSAILKTLDAQGQRLSVLERSNVAGLERVTFSVIATRKMHTRMLAELRESDATDKVLVYRDSEDD
jgi:putative Mg2+ transporter-C (MgtC) family protein